MKTRTAKLTDTDWILLKVLWDKPPQMMRHIVQRVRNANQNIKWSYKTYYTYLNNLCGKGFAAYETCNLKADRLYYPLITREEAMRMESESLLSHASDSFSKLIAAMAKSDQLTNREQQALMELVSSLENEERRGH